MHGVRQHIRTSTVSVHFFAVCMFILDSICVWFIVPLPLFRRPATFLFCILTQRGEKATWKKQPQSQDTARRQMRRITHVHMQTRANTAHRHAHAFFSSDWWRGLSKIPLFSISLKSFDTRCEHTPGSLCFERFYPEGFTLVKSPPPLSTEKTTVIVVSIDSYRSIWSVCWCVCVCVWGCSRFAWNSVKLHLCDGGNAPSRPTAATSRVYGVCITLLFCLRELLNTF